MGQLECAGTELPQELLYTEKGALGVVELKPTGEAPLFVSVMLAPGLEPTATGLKVKVDGLTVKEEVVPFPLRVMD
jgi:hypothetical protein